MKRSLAHLTVPILIILIILLALSGSYSPSRAQAGDPYSLIGAVNSLRAANGLASYEIDGTLMSIAQAHSDYQAAIGQVTHTGAGGTRPRDRAAAAGYGGGGSFFISENIAGGTNLSVDGAISMWLGDAPHIQTMLGTSYRDIGAGVAEADGFVYYTIDVAYTAGGNSSPPVSNTPGGPTAIPIYMVQTATPNPDGSIVHVVRSGQTLIGIALAYGVTVNEIKELNYLTGDVIYDGDELTIRRANTPGPSATVTATRTPTRAATATRNPTRTPTRSPSPIPASATAPAGNLQAGGTAQGGSDPLGNILVMAIVSLAAGGIILMIIGSFMKRKPAG